MGDCKKSVNNLYFYFWKLFLIYFILFYQFYIFGKCPIENYFLFYYILFYSISVIFFGRVLMKLCQWSLIYFISRITFHFVSSSNYKQIFMGLCWWPIKASHPSLYRNTNFSESFSGSIFIHLFGGIYSKTRVVHISLTECIQCKIWLLNIGGRPPVPQCTEFVFEEGGSISRTVFVMPQSISFFFLFILFLVCVF